MPSIEINKNDLENLLGKELDWENINDIFFDMKLEFDREENRNIIVEVEYDRPDMLSTEGIARSLKGYFGIETGLKKYEFKKSGIKVEVKESVMDVRPIIRCAVVKNVPMSDEAVAQIMQLQEKLHMSYALRRTKASVGVYDLDKTKPPYIYTARKPEKIKFIPLEENKVMDANQILKDTAKGSEYAHLLLNFAKYPILVDSENKILSMPPILNSEDTKLDEKTVNLFIDVTGTDERAVEEILTTVTTLLSERGAEVETVDVIYPHEKFITPELKYKTMIVDPYFVNKELGASLKMSEMEKLLKKNRFGCDAEGGKLKVTIPCYRFDIMHPMDIVEDIAMGYGYNNFEPILPNIATIGSMHEIEKRSNKIRELMVGLGFQEIATFVLSNKKNFEKAKIEERVIKLESPISEEYNCVRNSLIPKLLEFLASNKHYELPQKIFEVDDIVEISGREETKTKTKRVFSAAIISPNAGFTEMKSVLEAVLKNIGIEVKFSHVRDKTFLDGRVAEISVDENKVGKIGEINPNVLNDFELENPIVVFEVELEKLTSP